MFDFLNWFLNCFSGNKNIFFSDNIEEIFDEKLNLCQNKWTP